jgi:transposase
MTHSEFESALDSAILSGLSSAQVARLIGVSEKTVRRRKADLGRAGHKFPNYTQGAMPGIQNATTDR